MAEARLAPKRLDMQDPVEDEASIRRMLKLGQKVNKPTVHLPYHIDRYTVEDKEVECMVIAVPLNMAFSAVRVNPKRWDDAQGRYKNATLGLTIAATCAADTPPVFRFLDTDGEFVEMSGKKGLTVNIGLIDLPREG